MVVSLQCSFTADTVGAEGVRRGLTEGLTDMSLVSASPAAELNGYIGYQKPYATSHRALCEDNNFQLETRNAARAFANAVKLAGQVIISGQMERSRIPIASEGKTDGNEIGRWERE